MTYVFFGTPEFAAIVLERLLRAGMPPRAIVCNPDRPVGRGRVITPPPVKRRIANGKWHGEILQPEKIDSRFTLHVSRFAPELFIVAAYAKILPQEILAIPRRGAIGVHPSLLPKYRGTTPIQTAILNGEEETGVTLYLLDSEVDHGPIVAQRKSKIENRNYQELMQRLAEVGGELLAETLPKFASGKAELRAQNDADATFTKKFESKDGFVSQETLEAATRGGPEAFLTLRKIRALNPEPGVYTIREDGKRMKMLDAEMREGKLRLL